jgi:cell division protein FtsL
MNDNPNSGTNWGELYADKARQADPPPGGTITIAPVREARDRVYGGTMPSPESAAPDTGGTAPRNRRSTRRKYSPFNIILLLLAVAIVSVLYISNVLAVGRLLRQIDDLERTHQRLLNEQVMLHAQVNRLSSLERISTEARARLGLQTPAQAPVWLQVDEERVRELEQAIQEHRTR